MCEITESESLDRRLDSLAEENEQLEILVAGLKGLDAERKVFLGEALEFIGLLKAENERLNGERDRMRAACEAAREFLDDAVAYGFARLEKGRVLKLIRAALDGVEAPAGDSGD